MTSSQTEVPFRYKHSLSAAQGGSLTKTYVTPQDARCVLPSILNPWARSEPRSQKHASNIVKSWLGTRESTEAINAIYCKHNLALGWCGRLSSSHDGISLFMCITSSWFLPTECSEAHSVRLFYFTPVLYNKKNGDVFWVRYSVPTEHMAQQLR